MGKVTSPSSSASFFSSKPSDKKDKGNRQMVSLRWPRFGGTCLDWHKPSDKSSSLKTETLMTICRSAGRYPFRTAGPKFQSLAFELSCKERPVISLGALQGAAQGATRDRSLSSSNARSVSAVVNLKRKADDSKHGPEAPVTKASRAISDAEKAQKDYNDYWQNREEKIFPDLPGSSGRLGPGLQILAEGSGYPPFTIAITAGVLISSSGGITPSLDEHLRIMD